MFNIKTYIDSLPEDIEEINVSNKGINSLDVTRFKNLKRLICSNNQLTSLHLNENLKILNCSNNQLTSLHLNEKLESLHCGHNQLNSLQLNENLQDLYCSNNQLTSLHLNENLEILYCSNNQLTSLHLNKYLQELEFDYNPIYDIYEIIEDDYIDIYDYIYPIKQKLRILNQFRYLYYSLKFKKQFRHWLWVRVREPKIRMKYSHDYLVEHLHEDTDLDEFLDSWINK
jgi:Leucine-rich repeat (LRR) protein